MDDFGFGLVCPSRTGTREEAGTLIRGAVGPVGEPGTLTQGGPVSPSSSRLRIEPFKTKPPAVMCDYYCSTYHDYKAVRVGGIVQ